MKIKVMPDYTSTGLWDAETGVSVNAPTDIPYFAECILNAWQAMYDSVNENYEGYDGVLNLCEIESYNAMGKAIVSMLDCTKQTNKNEYVWWEDAQESSLNQKEFWVG